MGRSKKIANGEITNEKILGKLPKSSQIKSNLANLDFDEDTIDGISILSFKAYDDLKEYYPTDKIQPNQTLDQPKRSNTNKRKKCSDKADKNKTRQAKKRPVIKQQGASNLPQFDKSESEPESEDQKNLLIKTEESPPPSPLPDIPLSSTGSEVVTTSASTLSAPAIKSEGCSTSSVVVTVLNTTPTTSTPAPPTAPLPSTCGSGSPVYQPSSQHLPIPLGKVAHPPPGTPASRLPTPPSAGSTFYHGLQRQHPVAGSHPGLSFSLPHSQESSAAQQQQQQQHLSAAELELKLNAAKYDPRSYLLPNGRFPHDQLSRYRAAEYEKYLAAARLHQSNTRPLFPPSATPRPPVPSTPTPGSHSILASRTEHPAAAAAAAAASSISGSGGTAIHRRLTEKKWNSIHVYIARLIYKKQQEAKKDPLNGAAAAATGGESSARAFLASGKREVTREYPSFATGLHNLPPTPASPFPHAASNPFNAASKVHAPHHALGVRGMSSLHGLGSRFPPPSIRAPYSGLAAASLYGHPGYDPLRHSLSSYTGEQLSRLDQERLHQHLASMRSTELLSRTMYENSLRQHHAAAAHREHEMQQAMSREMLLHLEEQRRKLLQSDPQKLLPPTSHNANIPDIYMRPQHLQAHLKYPGPGSSSSHGLSAFPNIFNRSIDPRARFSHLIPPKGPE